ncbi:glycosyltransferase [Litorihabitans aurantiacus]|uniref:Glycosyl hydrolase n=1 Tax=Litorihabitans aurantiacus TaxID=1930061 RepID=A0AA37UPC7_9MICO|nr:glycosyltransferase [Litorihabitans aurantiacus]GMA30611.1 glycosyl hydrolase [Litorihabitans aurantiacus]
MAEAFSLLIPVYRGDDPAHVTRAFASSVGEQTRRPDEVVLVQDGPVGAALAAAIDELESTSPVPVVRVVLPTNVGLAQALTRGLDRCSHEIVARIDADDVSLPRRFELQVPLVEAGLDLVGSGMEEFADDEDVVVGTRVPRTGQAAIESYARFHDPFSHPTVVYRRSAVASAGGYVPMGLMEDYWLFVRMLQAGARVDNVVEPLVRYRVGEGAYARRGGWAQWRTEVALQRAMRRVGFTTPVQYVRNVVVRGVYRFVPERVRKVAYRALIARGGR